MSPSKNPPSPAADITGGKQDYIWKGPLDERPKQPAGYFIALLAIAALLAGFFYLVGQPLSIIVVAAALMFFVTHANDVPKARRYAVTGEGIALEDDVRLYADLKSFWMTEHATGITLYVEPVGRFAFPLSIPLPLNEAAAIRAFLRQHLPESRQRGELLADVLARITGII